MVWSTSGASVRGDSVRSNPSEPTTTTSPVSPRPASAETRALIASVEMASTMTPVFSSLSKTGMAMKLSAVPVGP